MQLHYNSYSAMLQNGVLRSSVTTSDGRILEDWARARTKEGILYYLNHKHALSQWDHPEYIRIMNEMIPINSVRYAAYRTACKLRHLQLRLKFHEVSLQCITSAFDYAGLRAAENFDIIAIREIERVISYIYRTVFKNKSLDSSFCADLMMNLLLNTFDEKRTGYLQVLKCKILLTVLGGGRLQEKYRYIFNQIADHNNCCTRRALARFLQSMAKITELLSEHLSFGISFVPAAVDSCFKEVGTDVGITEDVFLAWLMQEPQTLVWWTTLYRVSSAELVCHNVKCGVCKQHPVVGLRYQCLKCLGYNLCQDCFLHGRASRSHKLTHPIQEYCQESSVKDWRQSVMKIFRHRLLKSDTYKPRYLTISQESSHSLNTLLQETITESNDGLSSYHSIAAPQLPEEQDQNSDKELASRTICHSLADLDQLCAQSDSECSDSSSCCGSSSHLSSASVKLPSSPRKQILSIIEHLEEGQRQLNSRLDVEASRIPSELVEEHTVELQTQINRLKLILQSDFKQTKPLKEKPGKNKELARMESTPIVADRGLHLSLSPIGVSNNPNDTAVLDNKENHYTEKECIKGLLSKRQNNSKLKTCEEGFSSPSASTNEQRSVRHKDAYQEYRNCERLPSFTQLNWSERTSGLCGPSPVNGVSREVIHLKPLNEGLEADSNRDEIDGDKTSTDEEVKNEDAASKSKYEYFDQEVDEVKVELEKILAYLEEVYPEVALEEGKQLYPSGVTTSVNEVWDGIENYIHNIIVDTSQ